MLITLTILQLEQTLTVASDNRPKMAWLIYLSLITSHLYLYISKSVYI